MADILKLSGLKIQKIDKTADTVEALELKLGATTFTESSIATRDISGKIPSAQLPSIAITDVFVVADIAARDALTVEEGDVAKVNDAGSGYPKTFIYDGSIWIEIEAGGSSLDALSDVAISAPSVGQSLVYDGATFTNQTLSYNLDSLTDVTIGMPSMGQTLIYDGMNFSNASLALANISDVMVSAPSVGQSLVYDGVNFSNQTLSYNLDSLTDVTIGMPSMGQTLIYDGMNFSNASLALANISDVMVSAPSVGQSLVYDGVNFSNQTLSYNLDSLTDVTIGMPSMGQTLIYDGMNFSNASLALANISDVMVSAPSVGQSLVYDGVNFSNQTLSYNLDSLTDVTIGMPSMGQTLIYDGMNFSNASLALANISDVMVSAPSVGQVLSYDGVNFSNGSVDINYINGLMLSAPVAGQVISYDGVNFSNGSVDINYINGLMLSAPVAGQVISYDGVNFSNGSVDINYINGLMLSAPVAGQVISYDGVNFSNNSLSLGGGSISDVVISGTPFDGEVLLYNSTSSAFINSQLSLGLLGDVDTFTTAPVAGDILLSDGTLFAPASLAGEIGSYLNGNLSNSIVPDSDETYDLGSATNKFKDLYLSGSTIYIGGTSIAVDPNVGLVVGGQATNKIELIAGEAISANKFVYVKSGDGDVFLADNALPMSRAEIALMYFSESSYAADDVGAFSKAGQELLIAGTKGNFGYLGEDGAVTTTAPTASGTDVILLGFWKSNAVFVFKPEYLATN